MGKVLIVANLKSYKNENEAKNWLESFKKIKELNLDWSQKEIIICPSFTQLFSFFSYFSSNNINVKLGAQDVSPYAEGAFTGEVNAKQIKDFAEYVLIGHSERRNNFQESEQMLEEKVKRTIELDLKPIFFAQNVNTTIPSGVKIGVYEPPNFISTVSKGIPDDPKAVLDAAGELKSKYMLENILYGGSVDSNNVSNFTSLGVVGGVVSGRASLDAQEFIKIIQNA
jgi:triosephosphate isomerase